MLEAVIVLSLGCSFANLPSSAKALLSSSRSSCLSIPMADVICSMRSWVLSMTGISLIFSVDSFKKCLYRDAAVVDTMDATATPMTDPAMPI